MLQRFEEDQKKIMFDLVVYHFYEFPIGIIMIIMIWGFIKDIKKYVEEKK